MKPISQYLEQFEPANILTLLPPEAVEHMLVGFSQRLTAGVGLLYPQLDFCPFYWGILRRPDGPAGRP